MNVLDLVVPGWLTPAPVFAENLVITNRTSAGERLLRFGSHEMFDVAGYEATVRALLQTGGAGIPASGQQYRADPVMLEPQIKDVVMWPLDVTEVERAVVFRAVEDEVNRLVADTGGQFRLTTAGAGLLTLPDRLPLANFPPSEWMGKGIGEAIRQLDQTEGGQWARLFTEFQMVLHGLAEGQSDGVARQSDINGLWLWHGLETIVEAQSCYDCILCSDIQLLGHCEGVQSISCAAPVPSTPWGRTLLIWHSLQAANLRGNSHQWLEALEALERLVLKPLLDAVSSGHLDGINVYPVDGRMIHYRRSHGRRVWRRGRHLSHYFSAERPA